MSHRNHRLVLEPSPGTRSVHAPSGQCMLRPERAMRCAAGDALSFRGVSDISDAQYDDEDSDVSDATETFDHTVSPPRLGACATLSSVVTDWDLHHNTARLLPDSGVVREVLLNALTSEKSRSSAMWDDRGAEYALSDAGQRVSGVESQANSRFAHFPPLCWRLLTPDSTRYPRRRRYRRNRNRAHFDQVERTFHDEPALFDSL
ncbi:hypothetical protein R3P38DRAFT_3225534 [Favolaschia claudopus]|uniref:Uncharacterized protein n=1 Tax=Favolaschia claudopus TaxID=2862362 RepID=A0AAV9ZUE5_9AGAR